MQVCRKHPLDVIYATMQRLRPRRMWKGAGRVGGGMKQAKWSRYALCARRTHTTDGVRTNVPVGQ